MTGETVDLILTDGLIVTQDEQRRTIPDGAIAIKDGFIVDIGSSSKVTQKYHAVETIDVDVVPGPSFCESVVNEQ